MKTPPNQRPSLRQLPLHLSNLAQSSERRAHGSGGGRSDGVGTSAVKEVSCDSLQIRLPPNRILTYATVRLQDLQSQMPTEWRLTLVLPQKVHTYLACWVISIFLTDFRREAPYLHAVKSVLVPCEARLTYVVTALGRSRSWRVRRVELYSVVLANECSGMDRLESCCVRGWFVPSTVLAGHCEILSVTCSCVRPN